MKRFLLHIAFLVCSAYAVASACEDGTVEVIKGTRCRRYAECQNGSWHLKECKIGQIFDSNTLSCLPVTKVGRCEDGSKCSEGRAYSHVGSTNIYYRCINGRISVQVCVAGQIFDHNIQDCRLDRAFQHTGLNRAKRDADEPCKDGTKHRNGESCKDYIECVNGQEVEKTCPDCMNFDNITQRCRFVVTTPCAYKTTTPRPTDSPTTEQPPSPQPTDSPTTEQPPSPQPTDSPTTEQPPSPQPTDSPTTEQPPSPQPTDLPTTEQPPSPQPTDSPTTEQPPSPQPTDSPTTEQPPSPQPTDTPTTEQPPSPQPTDYPTTEQPSTPAGETTILPPTSSVGPCKDGEKVGLVDPECKAFQECINGVWVNNACGWARKFDAIKKECEYTLWNKVTCAQ